MLSCKQCAIEKFGLDHWILQSAIGKNPLGRQTVIRRAYEFFSQLDAKTPIIKLKNAKEEMMIHCFI
jgi:hypothetical protein